MTDVSAEDLNSEEIVEDDINANTILTYAIIKSLMEREGNCREVNFIGHLAFTKFLNHLELTS